MIIETIGLKWAPDKSSKDLMITYRIAPVAIVFPNSATDLLPADKLSPMIPEPITVATKKKGS